MIAALTRVFGAGRLALVEDVVQEAMLQALRTWPFQGIPDRPDAWLIQVAKNRALDVARRERIAAEKCDELARWNAALSPGADDAVVDAGIADDALRLIFLCCHPSLSPEARVALTLKTSCGFGVAEIARALLAQESAVAQRLARARAALRDNDVGFELPAPQDCRARLESVLEVLYLLFNEGYSAHRGASLVREDLVHEALRLVSLLAADARFARPNVHALRALFLLQGSRLAARQSECGELLTLARQDRARFDRAWIAEGLAEFERSIAGDELTAFHVEAAIAAAHAAAPTFGETDWRAILGHYDALIRIADSPIARLNRAVALAKVEGPRAALREVEALAGAPELARYHLLDAVRGTLLSALGESAQAAAAFERAAAAGGSDPERAFLSDRAARCRAGLGPPEADGF